MTKRALEAQAEFWRKGSRADLAKAERDIGQGDFLYGLFWAHLALEKLLKSAVIAATGKPAPHTHDLVYLADRAGLKLTPTRKLFLAAVKEFNLDSRYPEYVAALRRRYTVKSARVYLKEIKAFYLWLAQQPKA